MDGDLLDQIILAGDGDEAFALLQMQPVQVRKEKAVIPRRSWAEHANICRDTAGFKKRYHMAEPAQNNPLGPLAGACQQRQSIYVVRGCDSWEEK